MSDKLVVGISSAKYTSYPKPEEYTVLQIYNDEHQVNKLLGGTIETLINAVFDSAENLTEKQEATVTAVKKDLESKRSKRDYNLQINMYDENGEVIMQGDKPVGLSLSDRVADHAQQGDVSNIGPASYVDLIVSGQTGVAYVFQKWG